MPSFPFNCISKVLKLQSLQLPHFLICSQSQPTVKLSVCLALWFPSSFQSAENFLATKKKSMTVCHGCVLRTVNITPYFYNDYPGNFTVFLAAPTVLSSEDLVWNFSWSFFSSIFFLNQRRKHSPPRFFFLNTMIRILQRWVGIIK